MFTLGAVASAVQQMLQPAVEVPRVSKTVTLVKYIPEGPEVLAMHCKFLRCNMNCNHMCFAASAYLDADRPRDVLPSIFSGSSRCLACTCKAAWFTNVACIVHVECVVVGFALPVSLHVKTRLHYFPKYYFVRT